MNKLTVLETISDPVRDIFYFLHFLCEFQLQFIVTLVLLPETLMCFYSLITAFMAQTTTHNENKSIVYLMICLFCKTDTTAHMLIPWILLTTFKSTCTTLRYIYNQEIRYSISSLLYSQKNCEQKLIETKKRQRTNSSKKRMVETIVNSKRSKNNVLQHSPTKKRVFTTHTICCVNTMSNLILRVCREYFSS